MLSARCVSYVAVNAGLRIKRKYGAVIDATLLTDGRTVTNPNNGAPMDYYEIDIKPFEQQIYPNKGKTRMVGYDGMYPGPTFMVERGHETLIRFISHADRENSVHLHGQWTRSPWDGWADDLTYPGQYKDYYYSNAQSGRTLFYHDHAVMQTSENIYYGQAGFYIVHDPAEDALGLPSGNYDVPLGIIAKRYNQDGSLWSPGSNGVTGTLQGDVIHVNGQPWPYFNVEPRKYRFRILNQGLSRDYVLFFSTDDHSNDKIGFKVVGSDSGLLKYPVNAETLATSVAERWEVVFDFSPYAGQNITLRNVAGIDYNDYIETDKIMRFVVGNTVTDNSNNGDVPSSLRNIPDMPDSMNERTFTWDFNGLWTINGRPWEEARNRIITKPPVGSTEIWTLQNTSPAPHPVHVHLVDMEIISRTGGRNTVYEYEKAGQKDVFWLGQGETVKVKATFQPWDGLYMFHCHNTIHEDHSMMDAFNVTLLQDMNYPSPTLVDPMDPRFAPKKYDNQDLSARSGDFSDSSISSLLQYYASLNAYPVGDTLKYLYEYWNGKVGKPSASATITPIPVGTATTMATVTRTAQSASATKKPGGGLGGYGQRYG
jgi:bilirubin oxidase